MKPIPRDNNYLAPAVFKRSALSIAVMFAMTTGPLLAAEHPNTKVNYDSARSFNTLDMVVSIDWDFDSPPEGRGKTYIEDLLKQASQSLYTMTEGKQMLGKVYVYKNSKYMDNTDIQYLLKDGRANAHTAGFMDGKSYRNQMFAGTGETAEQQGKTVAHEFGHYVLGLPDEYREVGGTSTAPGSPQDGDTPRDAIMHDHLKFVRLSTADDYSDEANQKTAQFRTYGKSAWETITSDPATDKTSMGRKWFEPFKNLRAPASTDLNKPTTGWSDYFKVYWMGDGDGDGTTRGTSTKGPINAIVIDTTTSKAHLDAQINAASQVLEQAGKNSRIVVYAHPFSNAPLVNLTSLSATNAKTEIKTALSKLALATATEDTVVADRLFDWAEVQYPTLFSSVAAKGTAEGYYYRVYATGQALGIKAGSIYYLPGGGLENLVNLGSASQFLPQARLNMSATLQTALNKIKSVLTPEDTPTITLFTTATSTVDSSLIAAFRDARVSVNPVALVLPASRAGNRFTTRSAGETSLYDLAKSTFGKYEEAAKAGDLARSASKVVNAAEGDNEEIVVDAESADILAAGGTHSISAKIASSVDGVATFQAFWDEEDAGKLTFTLTTPSGTVITPTALPTGVTYTANAGEGEASYVVSDSFSGRAGTWTSTLTASAATTESVFQEVMVKSNLFAGLDLHGGTQEDSRAMFASVEVAGPVPVTGASVLGDVYSASSGEKVGATLTFKDDGVAPDSKRGDGIYSASLSSLPVGEYEIKVAISNDGTAVFSTSGSTKMGTNAQPEAVPAFQRSASETFKKEK